jgi:hypothetical protein
MNKILVPVVFFGLLITINTHAVLAQETATTSATTQPINLTVSPVSILLNTDPGVSTTGEVKIFNNSLEAELLELSLAKFSASPDGAQPVIEDFDTNDEYKNWIVFENPEVGVAPKEWSTVKFGFNPPSHAALSYYYAVVIKRKNQLNDSSSTIITGAPAVLVLATVNSPNAKQELQLSSFSIKQKIYEFLPAEFEVIIKNTGNVHLSPMGNIFIDSVRNKDIGILSINQGSGLVLPQSQRTYTINWDDGFPVYKMPSANSDDEGKVKSSKRKLFWDFSKMQNLRFGKYSAHLLMVYDNGERDVPVESTVTFWVIPWRFLLAITVTLLLAGLGIALIVYLIIKLSRSKQAHAQK